MWMSSQIPTPVIAVVVKFISRTAALQHIVNSERNTGGTIDPAYTNNQRVYVRLRNGKQVLVLVPIGMPVQPGEAVTVIPGHADPNNLCSYIPNLIVPSTITPP
jgi:hypothetical protein